MRKQFVVVEEEKAEYVTDLDSLPVIESPGSIFDKGFTRVPLGFMRRMDEIDSIPMLKIYLTLLYYINSDYLEQTGTALSWPGYEKIADLSGVRNHQTIHRTINKLIKLGFVIKKEKGYPPIKSNAGTIFAPSKADQQTCWIYTMGSGLEGKEFIHNLLELGIDQCKYSAALPGKITKKKETKE